MDTDGISLSFLLSSNFFEALSHFAHQEGVEIENKVIERATKGELSTLEICLQLIKPITKQSRTSFCSYLKENGYANLVQKSTVFISHAWSYNFGLVLESLREYFGSNHHFSVENTFIWFDIFTVNQHLGSSLNFDQWLQTFQGAVQSIGFTLLLLAPWDNPIPLSRSWCLFEIYISIISNIRFDITMNKAQKRLFFENVKENGEITLNQIVSKIDLRRSEATEKIDEKNIFGIVQRGIGFDETNKIIIEKNRKSMFLAIISIKNDLINDRTEIYKDNRLFCEILFGITLFFQGDYLEAKQLFQQNLIDWKLFQKESPDNNYYIIQYYLGLIEMKYKSYLSAFSILQEVYKRVKRRPGDESLNSRQIHFINEILLLQNLMTIHIQLGEYDEANELADYSIILVKSPLNLPQQSFTDIGREVVIGYSIIPELRNNIDYLETLFRIAEIHLLKSEKKKASTLFAQLQNILERNQNFLTNPQILTGLNTFLFAYLHYQDYRLGRLMTTYTTTAGYRSFIDFHGREEMNSFRLILERALTNTRTIFGESHALYLNTLHNYAKLLWESNNKEAAFLRYLELLRLSNQYYGEDSPFPLYYQIIFIRFLDITDFEFDLPIEEIFILTNIAHYYQLKKILTIQHPLMIEVLYLILNQVNGVFFTFYFPFLLKDYLIVTGIYWYFWWKISPGKVMLSMICGLIVFPVALYFFIVYQGPKIEESLPKSNTILIVCLSLIGGIWFVMSCMMKYIEYFHHHPRNREQYLVMAAGWNDSVHNQLILS